MQDFAIMQEIEKKMPNLAKKLTLVKVSFEVSENKAYFSFESTTLVQSVDFLRLERIISTVYPKMKIAVRVASPSLKDDFLKDIKAYRSVLEDFLIRSTSAVRAWLKDTHWELADGRILLTCPDKYSETFYRTHNFESKISQAVWDIFKVRLPVAFVVTKQREEFLKKMRAMRLPELEEEKFIKKEFIPANAVSMDAKKPSPKISSAPKKEKKVKQQYDIQQKSLYGKPITGTLSSISSCLEDTGYINVCGIVSKVETKELKGGKTLLLKFIISDETGSVFCKCFMSYGLRGKPRGSDGKISPQEAKRSSREKVIEMANGIKSGDKLMVNGECVYDSFMREQSITIKSMSRMPKQNRIDNEPEKRVELHMHTQMSASDAITPVKDLIECAAKWGHKAVAITDHGVVQAYPAAFAAAKKQKIKFIPGCEAYLCDYEVPIEYADDSSLDRNIVVLDFETTGLNTKKDRIIEIGAVRLSGKTILDSFSMLVYPGVALKPKITEITGIKDSDLVGKPSPAEAVEKLLKFIGSDSIAAHNAKFDMGILRSELERMGRTLKTPVVDTLILSRGLYPKLKSYRLKAVCKSLGISLKNAHRAVHDATATAQALAVMFSELKNRDIQTYLQANQMLNKSSLGRTNHATLLVAEQKGLENLYYLISQGHLKYFRRHMQIPRFELESHREGLLVGSACSEGELYQAVLMGENWQKVKDIAAFYDYIEVMPIENNSYLVKSGKVADYETLREINRKLIALGDELNIPVAATGDVHFMNPEDKVYREILQSPMGYSDFDKQPPLYLRTTEEMLKDFSYLDENVARKVVIEAPNKIADMIGDIRQYPVHPDGEDAVTFQPFWEDAEDNIKNSTLLKAHELYGDPLPDIVDKRIKKEFKSILGYGFGTLYNIAQKLVLKSNKDGYVVGSRGSVGSSLVAYMCGITEVNALPPHYRCEHCHKGFFDVPKDTATGYDLPDKNCPICGEPLIKDGMEIPFEVFLGFEGDKVPDIDLNFSGEYQPKAHAYVEELFGKGYVYRAGTIAGLAEKTAMGYVLNYCERKGITPTRAHKEHLAQGIVGIKRTTGQHPGGMVVLPKQYSIYQFTPIQHPADDMNGSTITTHFDFSSMHDILVKLDILGHDDPTMLHDLEKLTGLGYKDVPLDDKAVMSLFLSPEALGVSQEDIDSPTGTLGIPEFGTGFTQSMLVQTKPTTFGELIRISGLSHGTDVWLGNAEEIIKNGDAALAECICTRDDIMNALIHYGLESKLSFDIMEAVRKGRGLKDSDEKAMKEHNVPEWFIESCKKIKYMFPKGHAVAYVVMAIRIAYYKVHYPLAYYAAYFTIRATGFDAGTMILPSDVLRDKIKTIQSSDTKLSVKEKEELSALRMTLELQCRGFKLLNADIYKSDARYFLPEGDNALRVPLTALKGLGESVAESIVKARTTEFISQEDLKKRGHIGDSIIELLQENNAFHDLPKTAQRGLFEMLN